MKKTRIRSWWSKASQPKRTVVTVDEIEETRAARRDQVRADSRHGVLPMCGRVA